MADTVTYRPVTPLVCPQCHALWLFWPREQSGLARDSLNLRSPAACDYCENATADQLHRMERVGAELEASHPVLEQQARALADAERRLRIVSDVSMLLHRVADVAWSALDDSEELKWPDCRAHAISGGHFDLLSDAFDALDDLPDDKPGCTLTPADKARWMLQQNVGAWHSDDIAVFRFACAMREKMTKKRDAGYGGWNDKDNCPTERLQTMLVEHLVKGDPVDVGNFAMMLFNRGESCCAPVQIHWINDGSLPAAHDLVLIDAGSKGVWPGGYDAGQWVDAGGNPFEDDQVVAWARMPKGSKGGVE